MAKTYKTEKPVLGFRSWNTFPVIRGDMRNQIYYLAPLGAGRDHWVPGENIAECHSHLSHRRPTLSFSDEWRDTPGQHCHCGFNAFNTLEDAEAYNEGSPFAVFGAVAGCGKVQVHEDGWRSEKAQIIALFFRPYNRRKSFDLHSHRALDRKCGLDRAGEKQLENIKKTAEYYRVPLFTEEQEFFDFVKTYAQPIPRRAKPTGMFGSRDFKLSLSIFIIAMLLAFTNIFASILGTHGEEFLEVFAPFLLGFFGARLFIQLFYWGAKLFQKK